jgi:putative ABC transport system substrate-binding protein
MRRSWCAAGLALCVAFLLPVLVLAQPLKGKVARVGVLWGGDTPFAIGYLEAGRQALIDLGYVEHRDFVVEARFGERKPGAADVLAADLVQRKMDVIIAAGDPAIRAARKATTEIPIVMIAAGDLSKSGFVASLSRPGFNVTGMTFLSPELAPKRLQLLREAVPRATKIGVLWNPDNPGSRADLEAAQAAADTMHVALRFYEVRATSDFERVFKSMVEDQVHAVLVLTDPVMSAFAGKLVSEHALKYRLPLVCDLSEFTRSGALLSYGPSLRAMARRSAVFVDKILKGTRPGDIPIEQPQSFELTINQRTAAALGLTLPVSLLTRADDVIR